MPRSFGEPLTKLRQVQIVENGEPLVDPCVLSARIHFSPKHPKFGDLPRTSRVRQRVAEMLTAAVAALPDGIDIEIVEGFRTLRQQQYMYEQILAEYASEHPEWNRSTLHRMANRMCAPANDICPPPHTTGGAVDLYLLHADTHKPVDLTSPYHWGENSAPTMVTGLSPQAAANRDLLVTILTGVGLTNYAGEWWHWSYGDSGWALRVNAPYALYDRLDGPK